MREVLRKSFVPIHLNAGDSIVFTYKQEENGRTRREESSKMVADRSMAVDLMVIAEMNPEELSNLGFKDALAFIAGESA